MQSSVAIKRLAKTRPGTISRKAALGQVLIAAATELYGSPDEEDETIMSDIIGDLMHFCDKRKISFSEVLEMAEDGYRGDLEECEP